MLDYYAIPNVRKICHRAKQGDEDALLTVAEVIALQVGPNDIITPVPNRHGESGVMGVICEHVARMTGCAVWDKITGASRESQYASKKNGASLTTKDLAFTLNGEPPEAADRHFVIDTIKDTGTTLNAALALLPGAQSLVFAAVDKDVQLHAENVLRGRPHDDVSNLVSGLKSITQDGVAFSYVYQAVVNNPDVDGELTKQLNKQFPYTQHASLREGMQDGFVAAFNISRHKNPVSQPGLNALIAASEQISQVMENHDAGFHFEEGGCWGFAAALYDRAESMGLSPQIVLDDKAVHCYVKIDDALIDHQGYRSDTEVTYSAVDRGVLFDVAFQYGVSEQDLFSDMSWGKDIIDDAFEAAAGLPPEEPQNEDVRNRPSLR